MDGIRALDRVAEPCHVSGQLVRIPRRATECPLGLEQQGIVAPEQGARIREAGATAETRWASRLSAVVGSERVVRR